MNKYRLKNEGKKKTINKICIKCGKTVPVQVSARLPLPNTTRKYSKGIKLWHVHDYYFEHEVEKC